jgi:hypothetical protein
MEPNANCFAEWSWPGFRLACYCHSHPANAVPQSLLPLAPEFMYE